MDELKVNQQTGEVAAAQPGGGWKIYKPGEYKKNAQTGEYALPLAGGQWEIRKSQAQPAAAPAPIKPQPASSGGGESWQPGQADESAPQPRPEAMQAHLASLAADPNATFAKPMTAEQSAEFQGRQDATRAGWQGATEATAPAKVRGFLDSASFGLFNDAYAGAKSLLNGKSFAENLAYERGQLTGLNEDAPATDSALSQGAGLLAFGAPGLLKGAAKGALTPLRYVAPEASGATAQVPSLLGNLGKAAKIGVPLGAVQGAASQDTTDIGDRAKGAGFGAAIGTALPFGMSVPGLFASKGRAALGKAAAGMTEAQLEKAAALQAKSVGFGAPVTAAEALAAVSGTNPNAQQLQRLVELRTGAGGALNSMMGNRAASNDAVAARTLDRIAPVPTRPFEVGFNLQNAAEGTIGKTRGAINQASRPFYDASASVALPEAEFQALAKDPRFAAALKQVRADPFYNAYIKDAPDNSVAVLDAVKKRLDDVAASAKLTGEMARAGSASEATGAVRGAATAASPDYERALQIQQAGRSQILDPQQRSVVGQLAGTDDVAAQGGILRNPMLGAAPEVGQAVSQLEAAAPGSVANVLRQDLGRLYETSARNLQAGANQWGGANFAKNLGTSSQRESLNAAIQALPKGQETAKAVDDLVAVFEAQGKRLQPGSGTSFTNELIKDAEGGKLANLLQGVKSFGVSALQRANVAGQIKSLDKILADPDGINKVRKYLQSVPQTNGVWKTLALVNAIDEGEKAVAARGKLFAKSGR